MLQQLKQLLDDADIYISHHAIYINKLEKFLRGSGNFTPVDCHSCKFGQNFDKLRSYIDTFPDEIKSVLKDIDKTHCEFHEISARVVNNKDNKEDLERMKDLSTKLFRDLLHLKVILKKH